MNNFSKWQGIAIPALLFVVLQGVVALFLHGASAQQIDFHPTDDPMLERTVAGDFSAASSPEVFRSRWDGLWYQTIAERGYPKDLPTRSDGQVLGSRWAFYPLYPSLVRGVMALTGLNFGWAGIAISAAFALAGFVLLFNWIARHSGSKWTGALAVSSMLLTPASIVFQFTYTEGLTLFLLVGFLWLLSDKRYLTAIPVVLLLGLTRNIVAPLLLVGLIVGIAEVVSTRHRTQMTWLALIGIHGKVIRRYMALAFATVGSGTLWPVIVGLATGKPTAYMDTFGAWWGGSTPLFLWFTAPYAFIKDTYPHGTLPVVIPVLVVAVYLAVNWHSRYPLALRVFPLALATYIFTVTGPLGSEWRYLTLGFFLWPFTKIPATANKRVLYFGTLALLGIAALAFNYLWIESHWVVTTANVMTAGAP